MPTLPDPHKNFLETALKQLKDDRRIQGAAVGGSYLLDQLDEYSDLDLVLYISSEHYALVMQERQTIAANLGPLIESFSGEHVGEPRLLICLYGPPLLHVDLKFVSMDDLQDKVENPIILWEREQQLSSQLFQQTAHFPEPDNAWIEARFWTWIHYTATKIGRGELFEAVEALGFLRVTVLGPLLLLKHGARPQGVRKLEFYASEQELQALQKTHPAYDPQDCLKALRESVALYIKLRSIKGNQVAEKHVQDYLDQIQNSLEAKSRT